ncbi:MULTISPECIES: twin-arginine translocase TatA/TatE family subunit [Pyrobaculum]|uniref:Sec-independent protein translocase protein TatA n=2 Tax=Pyrobaculum arsenaticum TaxID=121277 RepID=A4WIP0_PYRAR|nr:twin-arginine translocase TatA/TatE family subunit [Pyrobaculum arsenaticum]ABP50257.1 Sec-independent protein translocase TatA [Pyrobaculum arsenaticum DSM 13514]MCY0889846.1 twin-arginine translocase TatA/TatE family subunit [Pyrobaculum arsenaticum]NYR14805.1 twin-arginine translocase TatA/TatE family subunit [Pyrobaculum arsenaticum]
MYLILGGQEWIVILIAIVIILIWGPSKLPSLARGMGEAIREFRKAASGIEEEPKRVEKKEEIDQKIVEMAKSLGISTEGKTKEQILDEINKKLAELKKQ